ncbi:hypothetical protein ACFYNO_29945 [Kitasatospora sp. NPDC006697]|uniref:hypothetical protein n=1 Tax=Kitasatospora sp. NPDC006697 TaxID=3364020 RepID=UPI0036C884F0
MTTAAPLQQRPSNLDVAFSEDYIGYVGVAVGLAWAARQEWIRRRVDSYSFRNSESSVCQASIDFTVPSLAPVIVVPGGNRVVVPLALADKSELSVHFDLRDASGQSICRLPSEVAARIGGEILINLASRAIRRDFDRDPTSPHADKLPAELIKIAALDHTTWSDTDWKKLKDRDWGLSKQERTRLFVDTSPFHNAVTCFALSYLLCVLTPGEPGQPRIVKLRYDTQDEWFRRRTRRRDQWLAKAAFRAWAVPIRAPAQDAEVYHFECTAPEGVDIREVSPEPDIAVQPQVNPSLSA